MVFIKPHSPGVKLNPNFKAAVGPSVYGIIFLNVFFKANKKLFKINRKKVKLKKLRKKK